MKFRISVILLTMVFSLSACSILPEEEGELVPPIITPEQIPFRTLEVERQDLENKVTVRGYITPSIMENHFFEEKGGRLKSINVRVGDFVQIGDPLIELVVDHLPETIEYQKLTIDSLQNAYITTQSIQELEKNKEDILLEQRQKNYDQMFVYSSIYTTKELEDTKSDLELAKMTYDIMIATQQSVLKEQANTLEIEKLRLSNYEIQLEASIIKASMDGVVTYIKRAFIGDAVSDYETLISVADVSIMQILYEGNQAYEFKLGMPVELTYKRKNYVGRVIQTPDSVPTDEKEFFVNTVIFEIDEVPTNYIVGDLIDVKAVLNFKENVIVLPKDAVKTFGSDKIVYVLENGEKRERYIEVGIDGGQYVEIISGLEQGDLVIIN